MVKPTANNIFAEPIAKERQRASGLLVSKDSAESVTMAKALAVGSKVIDVKKGDVFIYKPYATTEIKLDGKTYVLINEDDILGVKE